MISQLNASFFQDWGLLIILVVFLVFMLVFSSTRRKKEAKMAEDFANNLKVGDKIKTYSGIYGKILSIKNTPNGKMAVIETGEGKNVSYMTVDIFAIYNIETPVNEKKVKADEPKVEDAKDEKQENKNQEEVAIEEDKKEEKKDEDYFKEEK